jgi:ribonuclease HI
VILRYGESEKELSGFEPAATSQRMELTAAIRGLEALQKRSRVRVFSDSQYLVRGMSEWLAGWKRTGRLEDPDALKNQDLWQRLAALSANHQVSWEWVRGHDGHPFNERCDRLAKRAAEAGMRAVEESALAAHEAREREKKEHVAPVPVAPAVPALARTGEEPAYEADADGQFLLC